MPDSRPHTRSRLSALHTARESMLGALAIIEDEIGRHAQRKHNQHDRYERRKARGQCTATDRCKDTVVPGYTMCARHLRKSAQATERYRVKQ